MTQTGTDITRRTEELMEAFNQSDWDRFAPSWHRTSSTSKREERGASSAFTRFEGDTVREVHRHLALLSPLGQIGALPQ